MQWLKVFNTKTAHFFFLIIHVGIMSWNWCTSWIFNGFERGGGRVTFQFLTWPKGSIISSTLEPCAWTTGSFGLPCAIIIENRQLKPSHHRISLAIWSFIIGCYKTFLLLLRDVVTEKLLRNAIEINETEQNDKAIHFSIQSSCFLKQESFFHKKCL